MTVCGGCSVSFSFLPEGWCAKCVKKQGKSDAECGIIDNEKQCMGCGCVYPFLRSNYCNGCLSLSTDGTAQVPNTSGKSDRVQVVQAIQRSAATHQKQASQHRLNQPSGLKSAAELVAKTQELKKQVKAEVVEVDFYFSMILLHEAGQRKQIPVLPFRKRPQSADSVEALLGSALVHGQTLIEKEAGCRALNVILNFKRETISVGIQKSANEVHSLDLQTASSQSVGELFNSLVDAKMIANKHMKEGLLVFRIYLPATSKDDTEEQVHKYKMPNVPRPRKKRARAILSDTSDSDPDVAAISTGTRASSSRQYQSCYRSIRRRANTDTVQYSSFTFFRVAHTVTDDGALQYNKSSEPETILLAQDWQRHAREGRTDGGYIATGYVKIGFKGLLGSVQYAIFQNKPAFSTNIDNAEDLHGEFRIMAIAQYFLKSFYTRAEVYGVDLQVIRWNVENAFIGELIDPIEPDPLLSGTSEEDNRTVLHDTFLAVPLLNRGSLYTEVKWCGSLDITNHQDTLGQTIEAYIHHALVDSDHEWLLADIQGITSPDGSVCLFDPQAHTADRTSGHWDKGPTQIKQFLNKHQCNEICKKLYLDEESRTYIPDQRVEDEKKTSSSGEGGEMV
ncbi:hypothetical protein QCA50_005906 [Cerrena zonata]|uniref:Alpha-type protein kinase domain-containing protein n=1 Tax=Cerrena zonata TaxID=2478898 RepID=A0AAW0GD07_9APHY